MEKITKNVALVPFVAATQKFDPKGSLDIRKLNIKELVALFSLFPGTSGNYCIFGHNLKKYSFEGELTTNLSLVFIFSASRENDILGKHCNLYLKKNGSAKFETKNDLTLISLSSFQGDWKSAVLKLIETVLENWPDETLSEKLKTML